MDDMRRFLERVLPWDDPEAWRNLHYFYQHTPKDRWVFSGRACRTIDEMVREAQRALNNHRIRDLYICTSTQQMAEPKTGATGFVFNKAIRNQDNALQFRSFFIDLDIKPGTYADAKEGLQAFKDFRNTLKLPNPTVMVASGSGGFHIYWTLEEPISRDEWQPYASALALAAIQHGFKIDAACTIDAARVLRLPGTFNHKHDPKRPVSLTFAGGDVPFLDMKAALEPYVGEFGHHPKRGNSGPFADDLGAGIYDSAPPIDLDSVALSCPFVADAITSAGNSHEEPLWDMAVLISTFTAGGIADAHRMSSGHPDYTEEETTKRYERRLDDRVAKGLGWPQCTTIMGRNSQKCLSCPQLKLGKSPLNFGKRASAGTPHVNGAAYQAPVDDMPPNYIREPGGLIYKKTAGKEDDDEDKIELVCTYPLTRGWVQGEPWALHFYTRLSIKHHQQAISIPIEFTGNSAAMVKCLGGQGIALTARHTKLLGEFLVNWIQKLREIKAAVVTSAPFGWHVEQGKLSGFAFNGKVYGSNGSTIPAPMPDYQMAAQYTPKGNIDPWRASAKLFTDQKQPWINAILASSFAAPLVRLTGYRGFLMSCYSTDTGIGKSTAIEVAQMVWGSSRGVQMLSDTQLHVAKRMGILKALPLYWDELKTTKDAEQFVNIVFQLSGGREKNRLKNDTSMQVAGDWETLIVVGSNDSMIDHVSRGLKTTNAGIVRVFEFTAKKSIAFKMDAGKAIRIVARARDNYGHAGDIYAKWLGENVERVTKEVAELDEAIRAKYHASESERNWFGLLACLLLGFKYAIELGLLECDSADLKALTSFLLNDTLADMRRQKVDQTADLKKEVNVAEILSQFLRSMQSRHTLVTDQVQAQAGRPPLNGYAVLNKVDRLEELIVHHGLQQDIVRFSVSAFHKWLGDNRYPVKVAVDAMIDTYGMRKSLGKLGSGTTYAWQVKSFFYEIQSTNLLSPKELDDGEPQSAVAP